MPAPLKSDPLQPDRLLQLVAWLGVLVLGAGFFVDAVGAWTLPVLGAWFIGVQRPWTGAVWLLGINLALSLVAGLVAHAASGLTGLLDELPLRLGQIAAGVAPLLLYRLLRPRRFPLLAGLCLPLAASLVEAAVGPDLAPPPSSLRLAVVGLVVGLWIHEASWRRGGLVAAAVAGLMAAAALDAAGSQLLAAAAVWGAPIELVQVFGPAAALALVGFWTLYAAHPRPLGGQALALLRSPGGGERLRPVPGALVSPSGQRFPLRGGLARFAEPNALGGMNAKLNRLYAHIAHLYDDVQRIYLPLRGLRREAYMAAYLAPLEVRGGDKVLETSIGTGGNFRQLRGDIHRFGLDLSPDMLSACRDNFGRWGYAAELVQGNAEALPYADESFDVVFHVGGFNFFNDRKAALLEMIRVAKPGSLMLIADETEKHVRRVYEAVPGERGYFQGREGEVSAPVDLVPAAMQDLKLTLLRDGSFYVLSFRKPAAAPA